MKNLLFARKYWLVALATLLLVGDAFATGISGTLVVESRSKARTYSITVKADGSFETPALPPGSYTFKCTLTASDGTVLPGSAAIEYAIFNPKEIGLDHASEKRVNKIEAIAIKQKVARPTSQATWQPIAIDEPGVQLRGKIHFTSTQGTSVMADSWTATK